MEIEQELNAVDFNETADVKKEAEQQKQKEAFETVNAALDLSKPLPMPVVGGFVDKKALVGRTVKYKIEGLVNVPDMFNAGKTKLVLNLENEGNFYLLDLPAENQKQMMLKLGDVPLTWKNQIIEIRYEDFEQTKRDGKTLMKGVKWILI